MRYEPDIRAGGKFEVHSTVEDAEDSVHVLRPMVGTSDREYFIDNASLLQLEYSIVGWRARAGISPMSVQRVHRTRRDGTGAKVLQQRGTVATSHNGSIKVLCAIMRGVREGVPSRQFPITHNNKLREPYSSIRGAQLAHRGNCRQSRLDLKDSP